MLSCAAIFVSLLHLFSSSGEDDVVDRDEHKFNAVADRPHDEEAHDAGLEDLHVLSIVWLLALLVEHDRVSNKFLNLSGDVLLFLLDLLVGHLCRRYNIISILFMILFS